MKTATVLAFPSVRPATCKESLQVGAGHTAKLIRFPVKDPAVDILSLPVVFALAWLSAFGF